MKRILVLCLFFANAIFASSATINKYDTFVLSGPEGIDGFPAPWIGGKELALDFQISPYYTDSSSSISVEGEGAGDKPLFEEGGPWNLVGIYYNLISGMIDPTPVPTGGGGSQTDFLPVGYQVQVGANYQTVTSLPTINKPSKIYYSSELLTNSLGGKSKFTTSNLNLAGVVDNIIVAVGPQAGATYTSAGPGATRNSDINPTAKALFYPDESGFVGPHNTPAGFPSQTASYKRQGVRFKASANIMPGVKAWVRGGICQYKVKSNFLSLYANNSPAYQALFAGSPEGQNIYRHLFTQDKLEEVFAAFDIDPKNVSDWSVEDTFAAVEFTTPITFVDNSSEGISTEALRLWPTLTCGVWMPTARKPNAQKPYRLFDIPVSNQNHLGGCVSASASLELQNYLFLNSGFSLSVFNTKTIDKYMLPTNLYHSGVSLDLFQVSRKPGKTYLGWIGMFAKNFYEKWTAHAQYSITSHLADEITILDQFKSKVFDQFKDPGAQSAFNRHIARTAWSAHEFQAGLSMALSSNLEFSGAFKLTGMGENAPKTKTIMASFKLVF